MCTQQGPWNPVAPIGIHWHPVGSGGILGSRDTVDLLRQQRVEPNGTQRDLVGSNGIRWDPCIQGHPGSSKTAAGRGNSVGSVGPYRIRGPAGTMDPVGPRRIRRPRVPSKACGTYGNPSGSSGIQWDPVGSGIRWDPCIQGHPGSNKTAAGRGNSVGSVWPTSTVDPEGLKGSVDHLYQARSVETSGIQWDPLGSNGIRWDPWIQGLCTYSAGSID